MLHEFVVGINCLIAIGEKQMLLFFTFCLVRGPCNSPSKCNSPFNAKLILLPKIVRFYDKDHHPF